MHFEHLLETNPHSPTRYPPPPPPPPPFQVIRPGAGPGPLCVTDGMKNWNMRVVFLLGNCWIHVSGAAVRAQGESCDEHSYHGWAAL